MIDRKQQLADNPFGVEQQPAAFPVTAGIQDNLQGHLFNR